VTIFYDFFLTRPFFAAPRKALQLLQLSLGEIAQIGTVGASSWW
jgi:hypothetical protein